MKAAEREPDAIIRLVVVNETRLCGRWIIAINDLLYRREVEVAGEHPVPFPEKFIERVHDLRDASMFAAQVLELLPLLLRQQDTEQPEHCHLLFHLLDGWKILCGAVWTNVRTTHPRP